nr:unnamed protein product [Digitaria exilis]
MVTYGDRSGARARASGAGGDKGPCACADRPLGWWPGHALPRTPPRPDTNNNSSARSNAGADRARPRGLPVASGKGTDQFWNRCGGDQGRGAPGARSRVCAGTRARANSGGTYCCGI